jgi:hypothetical protein
MLSEKTAVLMIGAAQHAGSNRCSCCPQLAVLPQLLAG